jgi:hypothetical protein
MPVKQQVLGMGVCESMCRLWTGDYMASVKYGPRKPEARCGDGNDRDLCYTDITHDSSSYDRNATDGKTAR